MKNNLPNNLRKVCFVRIKKCTMIFIVLLVYQKGYSQFDDRSSFMPPSPTASAIMRYANTPVNMYTGVPDISQSIYNLSARGGMSIPITLSYHAAGIKVQDVASNVGLGWSLSTTCLITRIVRGLPDESTNGYFGSAMGSKILGAMDETTLNSIIDGNLDTEPDLFYYSLNGRNGSFVFDKNGAPVMLSDNGMLIKNSPFKKELNIDGWVLQDIQGNTFYLGIDANSVEDTHCTIYGEPYGPNPNRVTDYRSSWYLNQFITPNNTETITFNYISGLPIKVVNYSKRAKSRRKITSTFNRGFSILGIPIIPMSHSTDFEILDALAWDNNIETVVDAPKYLSTITTANQKANFFYDTQNTRQDLINGLALNKIEIKDYKNELMKSFVFNQDYFQSRDIDYCIEITNHAMAILVPLSQGGAPYQIADANNKINQLTELYNNMETLSDAQYVAQWQAIMSTTIDLPDNLHPMQESYRLKLNSVTMLSADQTISTPLLRFQYNTDTNLPPRFSSQSDNWGYHNNNVYRDFPDADDMTLPIYDPNEASPVTKDPDPVKMKADILTKIIYETGAYKDLDFEANQYYDPISHTNKFGGGLRVTKIVNVGDINATPIITSYKYTDDSGQSYGKLIGPKPIYVSYLEHTESQIPFSPVGWFPVNTSTQSPNNLSLFPRYDFINPPIPVSTINFASIGLTVINLLAPNTSFTNTSYTPFVIRSNVSFNNLFDIDGVCVGYSKVVVENADQGKIVNVFTDIDDYPDLSNQMRVNASFTQLGLISPNMAPFTPTSSYAFARGKLKESYVYDKNGLLLKKLTNNYTLTATATNVKGFRISLGKINTVDGTFQSNSTSYYNIGYYDIIPQTLLLTSSTKKSYEVNNPTPITQVVNYSYNPTYPQLLSSVSTQNSNGDNLLTTFKYVLDKDQITYSKQSETDAANQLYNDNKYGLQLQTTTQKNSEIINNNLIGYKKWTIGNNLLTLPETSYQGYGSIMNPKVVFGNYDTYGNVLHLSKNDGVSISTLWDYNNLYPVAECTNATPNEVFYADFENDNSGNVLTGAAHSGLKYYNGPYLINFSIPNNKTYKLSYWYRLNNQWQFSGYVPYTGAVTLSQGDAFDDIVVIPTDAEIASSTYHPLTGVTSITGTNRTTISYLYDKLYRLTDIKDNVGNIIKHYDYNLVSTPVPQVYFNTEQFLMFTKTNCTGTSSGGQVKYTVPANKYYSYTSLEDANAQAMAEINAKGQSYANSQKACIIYVRYEVENTAYNESTDAEGGAHADVTGDVYIRFYADAACSIHAEMPYDFTIHTKETNEYSTYWGNYSVPYDLNLPIYQGQTEYSLGNYILTSFYNLYPAWQNTNYTLEVVADPESPYIIPEPNLY